MVKTAAELFDDFVSVIDKAASERNIYDVPRAAEREGLAGGETQRGSSQRWEYTHVDATGASLQVECRWYDQSQAFSIQPDMHVMSVTLIAGDDRRTHQRRYEE